MRLKTKMGKVNPISVDMMNCAQRRNPKTGFKTWRLMLGLIPAPDGLIQEVRHVCGNQAAKRDTLSGKFSRLPVV